RIRFARSSDGGATFGAPVQIGAAGAFGHVDVVLLADGAAVVSGWRRAEGGGIVLTASRVEEDGALGPVWQVAHNAAAQPLDVPQMVATQGKLVFVWTDTSEESVRSAALVLE